jgi:hypothetical protein
VRACEEEGRLSSEVQSEARPKNERMRYKRITRSKSYIYKRMIRSRLGYF